MFVVRFTVLLLLVPILFPPSPDPITSAPKSYSSTAVPDNMKIFPHYFTSSLTEIIKGIFHSTLSNLFLLSQGIMSSIQEAVFHAQEMREERRGISLC